MKFCQECGASLKSRCPQRGFEYPPRAKFCGECGTALTSKSKSKRQKSKGKSRNQSPIPNPQGEVEQEVERYYLKAIEIARKQQAKSLELRAVMSLVCLRQQQAMQAATRTTQHESRTMLNEAHMMLSEVYHWFTEGFDTKDLQEAKEMIESLRD